MNDIINGSFELLGAFFIFLSVLKLYNDQEVKGVSWLHAGYFQAWGIWNLYYYPSLDQMVSLLGGIGIVIMNTLWLGMLLYYRKT